MGADAHELNGPREARVTTQFIRNQEIAMKKALLSALALALLYGCASQPTEPEGKPPTPSPASPVTTSPVQTQGNPLKDPGNMLSKRSVFYDYDKSDIRDDQVPVLQANAAWLKSHPQYKLLVEGHCDERDTIEYNLALGDRRAKSVRQYLIDLGVPAERSRTISYGEERPADPGHDEAAWAKNRRAEFTLEK